MCGRVLTSAGVRLFVREGLDKYRSAAALTSAGVQVHVVGRI